MDIPENVTGRGIELAENNIKWLMNNDKTLRSWVKDTTSDTKSNGVRKTSGYLSLILLILIFTHFNIN
jgi:hypothetical protein